MSLRAVVSGRDDRRERLTLGAASVVLLEQAPGDLGLGTADKALADDHAEGEVDEGRGSCHRLDFDGLLHHAQARDVPARVAQAAAMGAPQTAVLGVGHGSRLIAQRESLADALARRLDAVLQQVPADVLHELVVAHFLVDLGVETRVGDEQRGLGPDDQGRVLSAEAGEVAHVVAVGDEHRVEPALVEQSSTAGEAPHVIGLWARHRSSSSWCAGPVDGPSPIRAASRSMASR